MSNLEKLYWEQLKWILKHLKSAKYNDLLFDSLLNNAKFLINYVDANYRQDLD